MWRGVVVQAGTHAAVAVERERDVTSSSQPSASVCSRTAAECGQVRGRARRPSVAARSSRALCRTRRRRRVVVACELVASKPFHYLSILVRTRSCSHPPSVAGSLALSRNEVGLEWIVGGAEEREAAHLERR